MPSDGDTCNAGYWNFRSDMEALRQELAEHELAELEKGPLHARVLGPVVILGRARPMTDARLASEGTRLEGFHAD